MMKRKLGALFLSFLLALATAGCTEEGKLEEQMRSKDPDIRKEAALKLGERGTPNALRILQLHEDDPDFAVRNAVLEQVKRINKQTFMK
ncbi:MAG TPA: HEAT repeat domain-containing protein [Candidatus Ozemobacteraceae bacterium]